MAEPVKLGGRKLSDCEASELEGAIEQIVDVAHSLGLDFFEMRYEICPADIIYTFGAYAMPTRFSHWSFGKAFYQMKTQYDYGLSRIYELVVNSDPCYAFLLDTNSLLQNKLIAAHVLAHCDFFKNNYRFQRTSRDMISTMAAFASRVRTYEQAHGRSVVERFLDAVMAIHEHVDPNPLPAISPDDALSRPKSEYDDLWALDAPGADPNAPSPSTGQQKPRSTRDVLMFILEHSSYLADWQRDIISSLRNEMLYFRPQMETKVMNEGWASIWHARIMRHMDLSPGDSIEFARMHAGVLSPSRFHLNPYHLGFHLFEDIERRYGPEKIFEVRATETDVSFIRNYLTQDLVERLDLYLYVREGDELRVSSKNWEKVRDGIVLQMSNCGVPYIYAEEYDYGKRGELFLRHGFDGVELDANYVRRTLPHVQHIWHRPVHLATTEDGQCVVYTCQANGEIERKLP